MYFLLGLLGVYACGALKWNICIHESEYDEGGVDIAEVHLDSAEHAFLRLSTTDPSSMAAPEHRDESN